MTAYVLGILAVIGIYVILATSYDLILGCTGMLTLAHGSFFGLGGYATALLLLQTDLPFLVALLLGTLVTAGIAWVIGLVAVGLSGGYLLITSLAFHILIYMVVLNATPITRGPMGLPGIPRPEILGLQFNTPMLRALLIYAFVLALGLVTWRLSFSPFGRVLRAIRDNPTSAAGAGKDVRGYRLRVWTIGSAIAGTAGGLFATFVGFIDPETFRIEVSFLIVAAVILGGAGTFWGPVFGAVLVWAIPEALRFVDLPTHLRGATQQVMFGVFLVLVLIYRPQGVFAFRQVRRKSMIPTADLSAVGGAASGSEAGPKGAGV